MERQVRIYIQWKPHGLFRAAWQKRKKTQLEWGIPVSQQGPVLYGPLWSLTLWSESLRSAASKKSFPCGPTWSQNDSGQSSSSEKQTHTCTLVPSPKPPSLKNAEKMRNHPPFQHQTCDFGFIALVHFHNQNYSIQNILNNFTELQLCTLDEFFFDE